MSVSISPVTKRSKNRTILSEPVLLQEKYEDFGTLECYIRWKPDDAMTGVQFRDCLIDYTCCPNHKCIKKLV